MGQGYRVVAKAEEEAEIFLYEDVGEGFFGGVTAVQFKDDLKALGTVKNISLRINSNGGEVFEGLAIYRQLAEHKARVTAHIDGLAASIASIIAMAADEIIIAEAGFLMIHNASGVAMGEAAVMRQMADTLETVSGTMRQVYAARTGRDDAELKGWMDAETWFSGQDAVDKGFAHKLAPNVKVQAYLSPEVRARHNFKHPPEALIGRPGFQAAKDRVERLGARLRLSQPALTIPGAR
jgi:ATP-dependent protease ClpP protease subunit